MLKANGIVPAPPKLVRAPPVTAGVKREAEDQKPDIIDIEDDEIAVLQVCGPSDGSSLVS